MAAGKKAKKDARESGGIVAAVTKHAAGQFSSSSNISNNINSNNNALKGFASDSSSSPSVQSPDLKPLATPSSNGNPASPQLDAISSASFATSAAPSVMANEWGAAAGRGAAGMAGSPGNLISLMGESPPTQPSSYEDQPREVPYGWASPRPYVNHSHSNSRSHVSPSPPTSNTRRPLSYQMDPRYPSPDSLPPPASSSAARRSSLHSHFAQSRGSPNPPLPHETQPHFYGVPDLQFDLQPQTGMKAGERGYHFAFDAVPAPGHDRSPGKHNVVTAGYEGGLEVLSVSKRGLEPFASLKGLRGGVYHAKILPWDPQGTVGLEHFPLVAVVVHGPVLPPAAPAISTGPASGGVMDERPGATARSGVSVEFYQTSVEVYSLKTGRRVAVLLEAQRVPIATPMTSPIFKAPPPSGALQIKADCGNVVVSSGVTGESWVYRYAHRGPQEAVVQFWCVAKLWTTLQQPVKTDYAPQQDADRARTQAQRPLARPPILALSGRWIAYCPAAPSSQISLRAAIPVPVQGRVPGLASATAPQLPSISSDVDQITDSFVNKFMRDTTQELISSAKWVGQQGLQAFNNYWKGPSNTARVQARSPPLGSQPWAGGGYGGRQDASQFPPTHGAMAPAVSKEPGLISIVDTETLGQSAAVHPIATFAPPQGCSFLAFNPTGLALFIANSKGDVQTVWDLMRIQYAKSSPLQVSAQVAAHNGSRVRQVAQFQRLTVARIVDVSWARPHGERAAMVTERGTVHLLKMPAGAFTWPPPRRRTPAQGGAGGSLTDAKNPAVSMATSALSTALGVARPLINRPRRSSSNVPQLTGSKIVDHASHGGKVIVASISHSLGKTGNAISQLRHTGENRASLPLTSLPPSGCAVWITGRKSHTLYVIGDGLVRTFPNKIRKTTPSGSERHRAPCLTRYKDYKLPGLPEDTIASAVKRFIDPEEYLDLADQTVDAGNNTMVLDTHRRTLHRVLGGLEPSIPQAEIESSAPYQPFHTDRRVALYNYGEAGRFQRQLSVEGVSNLLSDSTLEERPAPPVSSRRKQRQTPAPPAALESRPTVIERAAPTDGSWVFGQSVTATRLDTGQPQLSDQESFSVGPDETRALPPSAMERVLQHVGERDDQIVITTRRRRAVGGNRVGDGEGGDGDDDDDGFFEDDCEVLDFADQRV